MILTLEQLKAALGIPADDVSKDAQLTSAVGQANSLLNGYIGFDLSDTQTVREYTYTTDHMGYGNRRDFVHLPMWPLIEVTDILDDTNTPIAPTSYRVVKDKGRVDFRGGVPYSEILVFHYRAGFDPVPEELVPVATNVAASIYNNGGIAGGSNALKSLTMFDAMSMSFDTANTSDPSTLITAWKFVLDRYSVVNQPIVK